MKLMNRLIELRMAARSTSSQPRFRLMAVILLIAIVIISTGQSSNSARGDDKKPGKPLVARIPNLFDIEIDHVDRFADDDAVAGRTQASSDVVRPMQFRVIDRRPSAADKKLDENEYRFDLSFSESSDIRKRISIGSGESAESLIVWFEFEPRFPVKTRTEDILFARPAAEINWAGVIDANGVVQPAKAPSNAIRQYSPNFQSKGVRELNGQTELMLDNKLLFKLAREADWNVTALSTDGKTVASINEYAKDGTRYLSFPLKQQDVEKFQFSMRPLTHFISMRNVSLDRTKWDEAKIRITVPADLPKPPKHYIARLPDGGTIELVGFTDFDAPSSNGWSPDGTPLGAYVDEFAIESKRLIPMPRATLSDALFKFTDIKEDAILHILMQNGATALPNLKTNPLLMRVPFTKNRLPSTGPFRAMPGTELSNTVIVKVADTPWGRWQKVAADGSLIDVPAPGYPYQSHYQEIELAGISENRQLPSVPIIHVNRPSQLDHRQTLEFRAVTDQREYVSMSLTAVFPLRFTPNMAKFPSAFAVDPGIQLAPGETFQHYEFRVRPFHYRITFENVTFESGITRNVNVKVEDQSDSAKHSAK